MESILLGITWCLPVHDCSVVDMLICNRSIVSFSTAAMHFSNAYKLFNRFRKIKPKKDVHEYKKTYNLKANTEASNVQTFY